MLGSAFDPEPPASCPLSCERWLLWPKMEVQGEFKKVHFCDFWGPENS
jgi:hypothetical protein